MEKPVIYNNKKEVCTRIRKRNRQIYLYTEERMQYVDRN